MNEQVYKAFLDRMNLVAVITDKENKIVYTNEAFSEETGYGEEAIGMRPNVLKSGSHSLMYYNNLNYTLKAGMRWEGRFKNKRKDGSTYSEEAAIFPLSVDGQKYYGKVAFNTTYHEKLVSETEQSIKMATAIQQSLMADDVYDDKIIIRTMYQPLENVSGDIYNLYRVNEDTYVVFLADVAGHGVGSALLSTAIIALANDLISSNPMPDVFLSKMNNKVMELLGTKELSIITYFTAAYAVIDTKKKQIHYANCGHPKMFLMNEESIDDITKVNFSIGMFANVDFEYGTVDYKPGSCLFMYTDGLIELESGIKSGKELLEGTLANYMKLEHKYNMVEYIDKEIIKKNESDVKDDVTFIAVDLI